MNAVASNYKETVAKRLYLSDGTVSPAATKEVGRQIIRDVMAGMEEGEKSELRKAVTDIITRAITDVAKSIGENAIQCACAVEYFADMAEYGTELEKEVAVTLIGGWIKMQLGTEMGNVSANAVFAVSDVLRAIGESGYKIPPDVARCAAELFELISCMSRTMKGYWNRVADDWKAPPVEELAGRAQG